MVKAYVAKYGGSPSDINADVAEAYSVGEVVDQAVTHLQQPQQRQDHQLPAQRRHAAERAGPGRSSTRWARTWCATAFIFQWQNGKFVQVLPASAAGSVQIEYPKPVWGS